MERLARDWKNDRSITGEFMRLNSPWQERYELAAGAVTTTPTLSNLYRLRHRQTPSLTTRIPTVRSDPPDGLTDLVER